MRSCIAFLAGLLLLVQSTGPLAAADPFTATLPTDGVWLVTEDGQGLRLDGSSMVTAELSDGYSGGYLVTITLKESASRDFAEMTQANVGKLLRIVLDGKVLAQPRIQTPVTGGKGVVSVNERETAEALLAALEEAAH
jgi:preprotein translocase subunit SecD